MNKDWKGIIKVQEIQHVRRGRVIWEAKNLYNTLHTDGEEFMLQCLFANDGSMIPESYYLGLDARTSILVADTINDILDEPTENGYIRQSLGSDGGWTVREVSGIHRAIGNIIAFSASGGSWGPVNNLFLTNQSGDDGVLLASVPLSSELTLDDGDAINMRMSLSLRDYPDE